VTRRSCQGLEQATKKSDSLCCLGGDEFIFLVDGLTSPGEGDDIATELLNALVKSFLVVGTPIKQRIRVGIAIWCGSGTHFKEIVQHTCPTFYAAKHIAK
jgi:GGDEF domain-containing protein